MPSVPPQETVKHWTHARWAESWASNTTRLHKFIPTLSNSGQDVGPSRRAWTWLNRLRTGVQVLVDLGQTCCAGDCPRTTAVTVVLNKRQTTSPLDAAPSTDHLRGSMASLFWTIRREHGSRTMLWTYEWCVMAHARRRRLLQNISTGLELFWDDFQKKVKTWTHPPTHFHSKLGFFFFAKPHLKDKC